MHRINPFAEAFLKIVFTSEKYFPLIIKMQLNFPHTLNPMHPLSTKCKFSFALPNNLQ